jgi:hypothetical protein
MKYIVGFGQFWWDFIVGDSAVLAIGGVGVLLLAYLLVEAGSSTAAEVLMPLVVFGAVAASLPLRK